MWLNTSMNNTFLFWEEGYLRQKLDCFHLEYFSGEQIESFTHLCNDIGLRLQKAEEKCKILTVRREIDEYRCTVLEV